MIDVSGWLQIRKASELAVNNGDVRLVLEYAPCPLDIVVVHRCPRSKLFGAVGGKREAMHGGEKERVKSIFFANLKGSNEHGEL